MSSSQLHAHTWVRNKFRLKTPDLLLSIKLRVESGLIKRHPMADGQKYFPATAPFPHREVKKMELKEDKIRTEYYATFPNELTKTLKLFPGVGLWYEDPADVWVFKQAEIMRQNELTFQQGWDIMMYNYRKDLHRERLTKQYQLQQLQEEGVQIVPEIDPRAQSDFISSRSVTELVEQEEEEDHIKDIWISILLRLLPNEELDAEDEGGFEENAANEEDGGTGGSRNEGGDGMNENDDGVNDFDDHEPRAKHVDENKGDKDELDEDELGEEDGEGKDGEEYGEDDVEDNVEEIEEVDQEEKEIRKLVQGLTEAERVKFMDLYKGLYGEDEGLSELLNDLRKNDDFNGKKEVEKDIEDRDVLSEKNRQPYSKEKVSKFIEYLDSNNGRNKGVLTQLERTLEEISANYIKRPQNRAEQIALEVDEEYGDAEVINGISKKEAYKAKIEKLKQEMIAGDERINRVYPPILALTEAANVTAARYECIRQIRFTDADAENLGQSEVHDFLDKYPNLAYVFHDEWFTDSKQLSQLYPLSKEQELHYNHWKNVNKALEKKPVEENEDDPEFRAYMKQILEEERANREALSVVNYPVPFMRFLEEEGDKNLPMNNNDVADIFATLGFPDLKRMIEIDNVEKEKAMAELKMLNEEFDAILMSAQPKIE